jgi:hypothetical protein
MWWCGVGMGYISQPKLAAERKIPRAAASRRPERHILHEPLDRAGEQAIKR